MKYFSQITLIGSALAASLFIGCGSSTTTTTSSGSSGTASDPYISGAKFYVDGASYSNVATDGNCSGKTAYISTASTSTGKFSFNENIPTNAVVKICQDTMGYHNGIVFDGNLSTIYDSNNANGVLSPMTTILATNVNDSNITNVLVKMLNDPNGDGNYSDGVGYPDYNITVSDLYKDPMSGLEDNVTNPLDNNKTFAKIRASIAIKMMMSLRGTYDINASDLNTSGHLASSIVSMKGVLNTNLATNIKTAGWTSVTAADIASIAVSITDAIIDANKTGSIAGLPNTNQIATMGFTIGTKMAFKTAAKYKIRPIGSWANVKAVEVATKGTAIKVANRRVEVNNDRNITFYSDNTYSEVNTTTPIIQWGKWSLNGENNITVTIQEDNVTGVLTTQTTKNWVFNADKVSLNGGTDLNITDDNSSISKSITSQSDINGTKIMLSGDSVYSRAFDTNGTYRQLTNATDANITVGTWTKPALGGGFIYTSTVNGTDTNITLTSATDINISISGITNTRTILKQEKLQY